MENNLLSERGGYNMLYVVLDTVIYLAGGLIMMILGHLIIDLIIPVDFPKEINEGNKAVAWVSAGIYAALGFIIRSAIVSNTVSEGVELLKGLLSSGIYCLVGLASLIVAYFVIDLVNTKFNFNKCLKEKNEAAGIMIFGIFLGIAFLVSGVIQ